MNNKSNAAQHDPWETGELGRSEDHVEVVSDEVCHAIDNSLALHPVSIRLEKSLIENLKLIARFRGVSYQPLVRDLLNRFARSELKQIVQEMEAEETRKDKDSSKTEVEAVSKYFERERKKA
jgi:predicted DNA-binding ribbon-helix-helix protein